MENIEGVGVETRNFKLVVAKMTSEDSGMNFYQVNQRRTFEREFKGGYLCSPSGRRKGWLFMKTLQLGDVLFNYNSTPRGAVLGISKVTGIGRHKGPLSDAAKPIPDTQCLEYSGRHLSEADFSRKDREHYRQRYSNYLEVHTVPLLERNLGKLLIRSPLDYLVSVDRDLALCFLKGLHIRLEDLS